MDKAGAGFICRIVTAWRLLPCFALPASTSPKSSFPESAQTLLIDLYMTDRPEGSARVFRVYTATPPHYHLKSNEYLYVLSGICRSSAHFCNTTLKSASHPKRLRRTRPEPDFCIA
jgi:hypothetical protein